MTVQVSSLDNGLRITTDRMETVETVTLGAWVAVGTRHETAELNGISHLLEHMAFKGTRRRTARAIVEEIEAVGGQVNAYTSRENTAYFAKVLKEDAPLAVDIIADILQNSVMDPVELDRERAVIIQEIHQANDTPDDIIFDHFQAAAFPDQAMGRPVLGLASLINQMHRDTILDYMRSQYTPPRIVVAAGGNIDHETFCGLAENAFTGLADSSSPATDVTAYAGGDYRENRSLEQAHVLLGFDGLSFADADYYALAVMSTILGGGMSSRLFQEVRENRGLAYSVYTFANNYEDGGLFGVYAGTGEQELTELVPVVCDEILALGQTLTEEEVVRARAQLKASTLMALESSSARAETLARQLQVFGRAIPTEDVITKIDEVDETAVKNVAKRIFTSTPTVAALGPIGPLESYDSIRDRLAA